MKASVRFDHQLLAVEAEHHVYAMLELTAPAAPTGKTRLPLHLAVVIDRSGSMVGEKLHNVKKAASFLARRMASTDEIAIIAYDSTVQTIASLQSVKPDHLIPAIESIWAGDTTNLSGGWLKGIEELGRVAGDGPRKVLLLTDGLANQSVIDLDALVSIARSTAESGIGTTTIGVGDGFNEHLLTEIARHGDGSSYYAATPDDAPRIFAEEFEGLSTLVAQNVSVEIRPSSDVEVLGILNDFPIVPVSGGVQVQLGDAYGEELRRIVFEMTIPQLSRLGAAKVADVVIRYISVGDEIAQHEVTIPMKVNLVSADEAAATASDNEVVEEVVILKAARAQDEARKKADGGDFEGARHLLQKAVVDIRKHAKGSTRAEELLQEAEQLETHVAHMSTERWGSDAQKEMHYNSFRMHQSRRRHGKSR